jgi:tetratricopeptide (TPR) repeat protein
LTRTLTDLDLPSAEEELKDALQEFSEELSARRRNAEEDERRMRDEERRQEEAIRRQLEEADARAEFRDLKHRFGAELFEDDSPISPLFLILKSIDEGNRISGRDEAWLKNQALFQVLGAYFERLAHFEQDVGYFVQASSNWRKASEPLWALQLTDRAMSSQFWPLCSDTEKAKLLTTRGGALRDIGELDGAEQCARSAAELAPGSYHPFNLLGGIYYSRGLPSEGDRYFGQAEERGAPSQSTERTIRSAFEKSEPDAKRRVAVYLLQKDAANKTEKYK